MAAARKQHAYQAGVLVGVVAVVVVLVLIPLAAVSLLRVLQRPVTGRAYNLMTPARLHGEWTKLNVAATSIDETTQTLTLHVTGSHNCVGTCPTAERVQFFSIRADSAGALGAPPSATIDLPNDAGEVDQQVTLPVRGSLVDYPFDGYSLLLGVALSRVAKDGTATPITPRDAGMELAYSVGDNIPRLTLATPKSFEPSSYDTQGVVYDSVASLRLSRPTYLQILTLDITILIVISAIYGVLFRPFTQIIPTVGGIVLGVWGVRSLLVGSYPPDSTGVDLVLESAIFLILLMVAVRSVRFMWPNTHFGRSAPPAD
jgi:hypothetical protein